MMAKTLETRRCKCTYSDRVPGTDPIAKLAEDFVVVVLGGAHPDEAGQVGGGERGEGQALFALSIDSIGQFEAVEASGVPAPDFRDAQGGINGFAGDRGAGEVYFDDQFGDGIAFG